MRSRTQTPTIRRGFGGGTGESRELTVPQATLWTVTLEEEGRVVWGGVRSREDESEAKGHLG